MWQALNGRYSTTRQVVLDDSSGNDSTNDDDGRNGFVVHTSEVAQQKHNSLKAKLEAAKVCKMLEKYVVKHADDDFHRTLFPENNFPSTGPLDNVEQLLQLDVKPIFDQIN